MTASINGEAQINMDGQIKLHGDDFELSQTRNREKIQKSKKPGNF